MAASELVQNNHPWTSDPQSSGEGINTNSLEMGMSGLSLVSKVPGAEHIRKETGSTIASSPPDDPGDIPPPPQHLQPASDNSSPRGSAPSSPISDRQPTSKVSCRAPPGLGGSSHLPSPIGHSKNTSATSPLLTLTPNSSVDGNSDWHSTGTHHGEAPAMPVLNDAQRNAGSFELNETENDGLLGLEALRDRAHSSPGPVFQCISSSPPVGLGHFPAFQQTEAQQQQQERSRSASRDRPPLSQTMYGEGVTTHQGDRSVGGMSLPFSSGRGGDLNNGSLEGVDSRAGFGAIGHSRGSEYVPVRTRSSSENNFPIYAPQSDPHSKFGSLTSMATHMESLRSATGRPGHNRSISVPDGRAGFEPSNVFHSGSAPTRPSSYHGDRLVSLGSSSRGGSISHPVISSFENPSFGKRVSMPNISGSGYGQSYRPHHQELAGPQSEDMYIGHQGLMSPGQSPLQVHYPGHSPQPSDGGSGLLSQSSQSPLSIGSAMGGRGYHGDEHPLVGENIDVPSEVEDRRSYVGPGASHPLLRGNPGHRGSFSLDGLSSQYVEAHYPPTAGAARPKKDVYSVKFKRVQRNFVLGPRINRDLKIGTYVKVEADRGEDLGIVVGRVPADKYNFSGRNSYTAGMAPTAGLGSSGSSDPKRIIRLATHDEVSLLSPKREEEDELLKICRAKVRQRGLPMNVVDAEYQFDRHKLTFFFEAEGRVDFRELVRDLFSMYKTRIWMQQLDKNTSSSAHAIIAPQPQNIQIDYGTPIIAPVSEFADSIVLGGMPGSEARSH